MGVNAIIPIFQVKKQAQRDFKPSQAPIERKKKQTNQHLTGKLQKFKFFEKVKLLEKNWTIFLKIIIVGSNPIQFSLTGLQGIDLNLKSNANGKERITELLEAIYGRNVMTRQS